MKKLLALIAVALFATSCGGDTTETPAETDAPAATEEAAE